MATCIPYTGEKVPIVRVDVSDVALGWDCEPFSVLIKTFLPIRILMLELVVHEVFLFFEQILALDYLSARVGT